MLLSTYNYKNERTYNSDKITQTKNIEKLSQEIEDIKNKIYQLSNQIDNEPNKEFFNQDYYLRYKIFQIREIFNINKINISNIKIL